MQKANIICLSGHSRKAITAMLTERHVRSSFKLTEMLQYTHTLEESWE